MGFDVEAGDQLPAGVRRHPMKRCADQGGQIDKIVDVGGVFCQWNLVRSLPGTLRGMHVHLDRTDYLIPVRGEMVVGLVDLRGCSKTYRHSATVRLVPGSCALSVPIGVLHGFYFPGEALHIYGLDEYWQPKPDVGCRWDDPDLGLTWGHIDPVLKAGDLKLGSLPELTRSCPELIGLGDDGW